MAEHSERIITVGEIARNHRVSTSCVRKWERKGELPEALRLPGGQRVWLERDLAPALSRIAERRGGHSIASDVAA